MSSSAGCACSGSVGRLGQAPNGQMIAATAAVIPLMRNYGAPDEPDVVREPGTKLGASRSTDRPKRGMKRSGSPMDRFQASRSSGHPSKSMSLQIDCESSFLYCPTLLLSRIRPFLGFMKPSNSTPGRTKNCSEGSVSSEGALHSVKLFSKALPNPPNENLTMQFIQLYEWKSGSRQTLESTDLE